MLSVDGNRVMSTGVPNKYTLPGELLIAFLALVRLVLSTRRTVNVFLNTPGICKMVFIY